jgi:hypothetical protein
VCPKGRARSRGGRRWARDVRRLRGCRPAGRVARVPRIRAEHIGSSRETRAAREPGSARGNITGNVTARPSRCSHATPANVLCASEKPATRVPPGPAPGRSVQPACVSVHERDDPPSASPACRHRVSRRVPAWRRGHRERSGRDRPTRVRTARIPGCAPPQGRRVAAVYAPLYAPCLRSGTRRTVGHDGGARHGLRRATARRSARPTQITGCELQVCRAVVCRRGTWVAVVWVAGCCGL